jgi:hypothetical protein
MNIFLFKPTIHRVPSAAPRINTAVPRSGCLKTNKNGIKIKIAETSNENNLLVFSTFTKL